MAELTRRITLKGVKFSFLLLLSLAMFRTSYANVPRPDHVVICILENHDFNSIIGSSAAPFINSLVPQSANMKEFYALTHPSQPNYIMLFSGTNHGVTSNSLPSGIPWNTPNLGGLLINAGFTFRGYSEDLPSVGSTVASSGDYARKHNPWVNWQGTGVNQIPAGYNLTMNEFPTDFNQLPDLCFVIPNQANDMHNGSDPHRITRGDTWVQNNLGAYITWAQSNNSLFILLFDEDAGSSYNHIPCLFLGPMVQPGDYYLNGYNHYDMLRTLEDMFGLPYAGNSVSATTIKEIWKTTSVNSVKSNYRPTFSFYPNPLTDQTTLIVTGEIEKYKGEFRLVMFDALDRLVRDEKITDLISNKEFILRRNGLKDGLYTFRLLCGREVMGGGKLVIN